MTGSDWRLSRDYHENEGLDGQRLDKTGITKVISSHSTRQILSPSRSSRTGDAW